jgi:hypothetical protein
VSGDTARQASATFLANINTGLATPFADLTAVGTEIARLRQAETDLTSERDTARQASADFVARINSTGTAFPDLAAVEGEVTRLRAEETRLNSELNQARQTFADFQSGPHKVATDEVASLRAQLEANNAELARLRETTISLEALSEATGLDRNMSKGGFSEALAELSGPREMPRETRVISAGSMREFLVGIQWYPGDMGSPQNENEVMQRIFNQMVEMVGGKAELRLPAVEEKRRERPAPDFRTF